MRHILAVFLALMPLAGYAKSVRPEKLPADSVFSIGEEFYRGGDYRKAVRYLDYFVLNYPVKAEVVTAQYHLADSYFKLGRYDEAAVEFEFLYKQFPTSPYAEEARLRAAQATFEASEPYYREQKLTLDAKRMVERFMENYPTSDLLPQAHALLVRIDEKLARKELEAAKLYFKFKEYEAAVTSLEYILATYPLAKRTNTETRYYLGRCKAKLGEREEAEAILEELVGDPEWGGKAEKALERLAKGK